MRMKMKKGNIHGGRLGAEAGVAVEVEKGSAGCVRMKSRLYTEIGENAGLGLGVEVGMTVETEKSKVRGPGSGGRSLCVRTGSTVRAIGQMDTTRRSGPCRRGVRMTTDFVPLVVLLMARM